MASKTCPKCSANMENGFVIDATEGGLLQAQWAEGEPKKSFWLGVLVKKAERHPITTYRCANCGYLESYAVIE